MIRCTELCITTPHGTETFSGMATSFVRRMLSDEPGGETAPCTAVFRIPFYACTVSPALGDTVCEKGAEAARYKVVGVTKNAVGGFPHYRVEAR